METDLLEVSLARSQEDDGVVRGGGGGDRRQQGVLEREHRDGGHWFPAAQRRVHVQAAEVLAYRLQLL